MRIIGRAKKVGFAKGWYSIKKAADPWEDAQSTKQAKVDLGGKQKKLRESEQRLKNGLTRLQWGKVELEIGRQIWIGRNEVEVPRERELRPIETNIDEVASKNTTDMEIPEDIMMALGWGPKFVFPVNVLDPIRTLPCLTNMINNRFTPAEGEEAMKHVAIALEKKKKMKDVTDQTEWLNLIRMRVTDFFKEHKELIATGSDKGKHTIVMSQEHYEKKMLELLDDKTTYKKKTCTLKRNIAKNKQIICRMIKAGILDHNQKWKYDDTTATTAKIYGLPKLHKQGYPLRPITSTTNSPGARLSTYITQILTTVFGTDELHIKNSEEVRGTLDAIRIESDDILASFDVVSMFTNIPLEKPLELIRRKWREVKIGFRMEPDFLTEILRFLLIDCATFTYKEQTYQQIRGLAMGSSLSPLLARIVMTDIINRQINTMMNPPKLLKVYVDDTICIAKKDKVNEILMRLNAYHATIQFTVEIEGEIGINFLNMTLKRKGARITTNWYKKEYASDRMLNYMSSHERTQIRATAIAHIKTVINLSAGRHFHENRKKVQDTLRLNNFPEITIIELLNTHFTLMKPTGGENTRTHNQYLAIPSINGIDALNRRNLENFTTAKITIRPDRSNSNMITKNKDKLKPEEGTNMIVMATCNCTKKVKLERTNYKERAEGAITRMKQRIQEDEEQCTESTHHWTHKRITTTNGGNIYGEFRERSQMIAFSKRKTTESCRWDQPHGRIRKYLE